MRCVWVERGCHASAFWRRLDRHDVAKAVGITTGPYLIVSDRVSDKGVVKYDSTEEGVNCVVFGEFLHGLRVGFCPSWPADTWFLSDVAEGLGHLHSQNTDHGRLRSVSPCLNTATAKRVTFFSLTNSSISIDQDEAAPLLLSAPISIGEVSVLILFLSAAEVSSP